jgi:benzodiazapine receptor
MTCYFLQCLWKFACWPQISDCSKSGQRVLSSHTVLLGVLTATVVEFNKVSPQAAYLLLPYLGWSTFAAVLTLDIWKRNPEVT